MDHASAGCRPALQVSLRLISSSLLGRHDYLYQHVCMDQSYPRFDDNYHYKRRKNKGRMMVRKLRGHQVVGQLSSSLPIM